MEPIVEGMVVGGAQTVVLKVVAPTLVVPLGVIGTVGGICALIFAGNRLSRQTKARLTGYVPVTAFGTVILAL